MKKDTFAYYFKKVDYHLGSGKGISVFNADGNLFQSFKSRANEVNLRILSFKTSDYLKHQNLSKYDETTDCVIIYQDVNIENLQKIIDPFVNKIIYPAFYTKKPICFFTSQDYDSYCQYQIKSGLIHTDLNKVISALLNEQLIKLLDQANYRFSSPEFLKTSWEKTIYTPIEHILKEALEKENISFTPQVKLGRFYVDFLVGYNNQKVIVECDGREYHNPHRDKERDKELSKEGYKILHFTGSEIYNNIDSCIRKIQNISYGTRSQEYSIDEDLLKDESQLKTLNFITGPIRVLAPAGSGKTKTLINKIVQLLNKGVEPNSILALAFNKKAAEEMRQRLKYKGIPVAEHFTKDEGVAVQTFHSFSYEIIRNKLNWVFNEQNADKTTRDLLRKAVERYHRIVYQRNIDPLDFYLEALRRTKMELPPIDEVVVEENNRFIPFKNIFYSYLDYQKEHTFINFDDMIYISLRILIDDRISRNQLQNRFRYVLVDEFQDLNRAQLLMMQIVVLPQNNIFIVGDDDQMIYGWRGAEVKHILEFNKRYGVCQDCTLSTNYRSSKKIVNYSKWLIDHNKERVPKNIKPLPDAERGIIQIELKENLWEQAKVAAKWIRDLKNEKNLNWNDFAVLYRFHAYQFPVAMALDSLRIPHSPVSGKRLFQTRVGKDIYSYLTVILKTNDAQREDFERIMERPNKYFTNAIIDRVRDWDTFTNSFREKGLRDWERNKLKAFCNKD